LAKSERLSVKLGGKSGMGHDDLFPSPRPSDRRQFCQETFARSSGNERDAPIPDLPAGRRWNIKFEEMGSVDYTVDLHRMTAPNVSIPS
jgi:hypothetical protein